MATDTKFTLTCNNCGGSDVQPFYENVGEADPNSVGLNCRDCGNLATMPELEKTWLDAIRNEKASSTA